MDIFLGSSTQRAELMHEIASWIEAKKHTPKKWDAPGVFPPGVPTFSRLLEITQEVQGAIFIFGEDDEQWYRDDTTKVTRDNVLIEYGLFTGALGAQNAIICKEGDPKSPTDLNGVTYIDVSPNRKSRAQVEIEKWLNELSATTSLQRTTIRTTQTATQLFDKRDRLGSDEIAVLNLLIESGKQDNFAMTYADINAKYPKTGKGAIADTPITKLIKRGFLQIEPGKIKACSLTDLAWGWIKLSDDLMNNPDG